MIRLASSGNHNITSLVDGVVRAACVSTGVDALTAVTRKLADSGVCCLDLQVPAVDRGSYYTVPG